MSVPDRNTLRITQLGTVFVPVADQDRALAFWVGKLGFEKRGDFSYGGGRRAEVAPPGSANAIALVGAGEGRATVSEDYPHLTGVAAAISLDAGAVFVGIDALNIDNDTDGTRPVHTVLLRGGDPDRREPVRPRPAAAAWIPLHRHAGRDPGSGELPGRAHAIVHLD